MNILFILGNGFDLQLGLPTAYSDFYKYYTSLGSNTESIKKLKDEIKNEPDNWSDLEIALGKFTSKTKSYKEFCDAYDDLQAALKDYILAVDDMVTSGELSINATVDTLMQGFHFPERAFDDDAKYTIEGEFDRIDPQFKLGNSTYEVNIATFNYTHVVENLRSKKLNNPHTYLDRQVNSLFHIHREAKENQSFWIGIDNEEQISNVLYRSNNEVIHRLLKPKLAFLSSRRMVNDLKAIISSAEVLVIFGASLGPTDMTWAKLLAQKIEEGAVVLLFVHNCTQYQSDNVKLIEQERIRNEFVEKMNAYGVKILDTNRIFININSSIFTADLSNNHDENHRLVLDRLYNSQKNM